MILFGHIMGFIAGFLTLVLPFLLWPRDVPKLSSQMFTQQYPQKKWIHYIHFALPIIWGLLYIGAFFRFNLLDSTFYFISFGFGGGIAIVHSVIEIFTGVSMRNFSAQQDSDAAFIVDDAVRRVGFIRLGLVLVGGVLFLAL